MSKSQAFESPNYTQVPNEFFDAMLREIDSLAELKVTVAIIRATFGWHKDEDQLSLSQLQERAGLSRQGASDGVQAALKRGYVSRRKEGQAYLYSINVKGRGANDLGTSGEGGTGQGSGPGTSQQRGPAEELPGVEASPRSRPTKEKQPSKKTEKEKRPDAFSLCHWLEEEAEAEPRATYPKSQLDAADWMLANVPKADIAAAVRWAHTRSFWASKVLTAGELKKWWPKLRAEWRAGGKGGGGRSKADSIDSKVDTLRRGARS